jgi:hypothetical protein
MRHVQLILAECRLVQCSFVLQLFFASPQLKFVLKMQDETEDSFYEELEHVFNHFSKYHMKILLGDFKAKVGRRGILNPTIGNESLHKTNTDNGVRVTNFATSKI